jgi:hypothetical protein
VLIREKAVSGPARRRSFPKRAEGLKLNKGREVSNVVKVGGERDTYKAFDERRFHLR